MYIRKFLPGAQIKLNVYNLAGRVVTTAMLLNFDLLKIDPKILGVKKPIDRRNFGFTFMLHTIHKYPKKCNKVMYMYTD